MSTKFKVLKHGFATNEPHPSDDVLQWLKWNDGNLRTYPKWVTELQSICPIDYRELARGMYLSWQWPKAVDKFGILNIPCPPAPDHLTVWMFKVDDLSHLKLMPNHYLCVQYAQALQFVAATTTNAVMCQPAESLTAFIMSMSPFYTITENMWQNHALTPPFYKPYHEFDPQKQAMQYFDSLRDVREEALCFEEAQRKVSFHDSIPRYKREEGFLYYGRGQGSCIISQGDKASTVGATSDAITGQFADTIAPAAATTLSLESMPTLEDAGPLIGAIAPDTGTYKPTGNNFTRSHTPGTEDDESDDPPASSQGTAIESPPDNKEQDNEDHLLTPDVHSGTPDLIVDQPIQEQHGPVRTPTQQDAPLPTSPASIQSASFMVDPLQVLLASAPPVMGSPTITEEED